MPRAQAATRQGTELHAGVWLLAVGGGDLRPGHVTAVATVAVMKQAHARLEAARHERQHRFREGGQRLDDPVGRRDVGDEG
jgi:hypothetical protein